MSTLKHPYTRACHDIRGLGLHKESLISANIYSAHGPTAFSVLDRSSLVVFYFLLRTRFALHALLGDFSDPSVPVRQNPYLMRYCIRSSPFRIRSSINALLPADFCELQREKANFDLGLATSGLLYMLRMRGTHELVRTSTVLNRQYISVGAGWKVAFGAASWSECEGVNSRCLDSTIVCT
jgi:hypothetical protein